MRSSAKDDSSQGVKLEPFEQKVADELKGLISQESAIEIAKKAIDIPDNFKLQSATLNKDGDFPELRIWSFQWNLEEKNYYGWASVEVDAKTGKVFAFDFNEKDSSTDTALKHLKIKTRAEAEKLVNNFLQENYPEVVENLRPQTDNNIIRPLAAEDENNQPSYYFNFERLVNGIPSRPELVSTLP
jgi:hypothetical protein